MRSNCETGEEKLKREREREYKKDKAMGRRFKFLALLVLTWCR